ncbi:MAG: hypothetical protein COW58_11210 [Thalassolituus sp. CG17_big_fil_post_rev_8_21_14_2_50_53_8]|nr:MAG: hypothetical protein COW58_11210 [Thalassolituus sp. CG17_big_fil_post_rev_8_21_14_2_50_53_8]
MESILSFFASKIGVVLPLLITMALALFTTFGKRILEQRIESKFSVVEIEPKDRDQIEDKIELLIKDESTTIELLEEIWEAKRSWFFDGNRRILKLHQITEALRSIMRKNIGKDEFSVIKGKAMSLIQDAQEKIRTANERQPFDGLGEPEKSLLIDLLEVMPDDKPIPRQKTIQLANIIKLKHQDMLQLQQDNAKSSAWTKWGTAGTVFFGILSIVLSIYLTK